MGGTIRTCVSWLILPIEVICASGVGWVCVFGNVGLLVFFWKICWVFFIVCGLCDVEIWCFRSWLDVCGVVEGGEGVNFPGYLVVVDFENFWVLNT